MKKTPLWFLNRSRAYNSTVLFATQPYRQRDLELSLLNGVCPNTIQSSTPSQGEDTPTVDTSTTQSKQTQQTVSDPVLVLRDIARDRQQLLSFERPTQSNANAKDLPQVQKVADGLLKTSAISQDLQSLIKQGHIAQCCVP